MVDHHFPRGPSWTPRSPQGPQNLRMIAQCHCTSRILETFWMLHYDTEKPLFAKICRCPVLVAQHVLTRKGSFFVCESPSPIRSTQPHRSWFILKWWQWCRKPCFLIGCLPPSVVSSRSKQKKNAQRWAPVGTGRQACSIPASCEGSLAFFSGGSSVWSTAHGMDWLWANTVYPIYTYIYIILCNSIYIYFYVYIYISG